MKVSIQNLRITKHQQVEFDLRQNPGATWNGSYRTNPHGDGIWRVNPTGPDEQIMGCDQFETADAPNLGAIRKRIRRLFESTL